MLYAVATLPPPPRVAHPRGTILAVPTLWGSKVTGWRFYIEGCECSRNASAYHETLKEAESCATRVLRKATP